MYEVYKRKYLTSEYLINTLKVEVSILFKIYDSKTTLILWYTYWEIWDTKQFWNQTNITKNGLK